MVSENTVPEKQISEFVAGLQQAAGSNLESVILYGSAATGEYDPDYSNINLLAILKETALSQLLNLAPAIKSWTEQGRPAPCSSRARNWSARPMYSPSS